MDNKKIYNIVLVGFLSFFYSFAIFYSISFIYKANLKTMVTSPLNLAMYAVPLVLIVYIFFYDKLTAFFEKTSRRIILCSVPFIFLFIGFIASLVYDSNIDDPKNNDQKIEEYNKGEIYEPLEEFVDKNDYKIDDDGNIYYIDEYNNVTKKEPMLIDTYKQCAFNVYIVKSGYIFACNNNEDLNFFSADKNMFYNLNLPKEKFNLDYYTYKITEVDKKNSTFQEIKHENRVYYTIQSFGTLYLYEKFDNKYSIITKKFDLEETIKAKYPRSEERRVGKEC